MSNEDLIEIIWLEPTWAKCVKEQATDRISRKRIKAGFQVIQDEVVKAKYRKNWYKAKIISTVVNNDKDRTDSESDDDWTLAKYAEKWVKLASETAADTATPVGTTTTTSGTATTQKPVGTTTMTSGTATTQKPVGTTTMPSGTATTQKPVGTATMTSGTATTQKPVGTTIMTSGTAITQKLTGTTQKPDGTTSMTSGTATTKKPVRTTTMTSGTATTQKPVGTTTMTSGTATTQKPVGTTTMTSGTATTQKPVGTTTMTSGTATTQKPVGTTIMTSGTAITQKPFGTTITSGTATTQKPVGTTTMTLGTATTQKPVGTTTTNSGTATTQKLTGTTTLTSWTATSQKPAGTTAMTSGTATTEKPVGTTTLTSGTAITQKPVRTTTMTSTESSLSESGFLYRNSFEFDEECYTSYYEQDTFEQCGSLSEQMVYLAQQNRMIMENISGLRALLSKQEKETTTIKTNLEYLVKLIKARSEVKSSSSATGAAVPGPSSSSGGYKPRVILSTTAGKMRLGGTDTELDSETYIDIFNRFNHAPSTVAVKLLSELFQESELYNKNVTGKIVARSNRETIHKNRLDPVRLNAIISQIILQFPGYMDNKENAEKVYNAINGKCRKITEKMDKAFEFINT